MPWKLVDFPVKYAHPHREAAQPRTLDGGAALMITVNGAAKQVAELTQAQHDETTLVASSGLMGHAPGDAGVHPSPGGHMSAHVSSQNSVFCNSSSETLAMDPSSQTCT